MWGNEMLLTPAPLWKWRPTWTNGAIASFGHVYTLLLADVLQSQLPK